MAHRPRWTLSQVTELFEKPLLDLLFEAQQVHRQHFDPRQVQVSTLLSMPAKLALQNRAGSRAVDGS